MQARSKILSIVLLGFLLSAFGFAEINAQEPSFDGKTIRIVVGFSAGGGFDAYARAIARHLGKHIPGKPTVIVDNMPGAGSLIAANFTYNQAKPDGLTIGHFIGGVVVGQLLGNPGAQFDSQKFEWIGAPSKLEAGDVRVVIQAVPKHQPDLTKVAVAVELAKSEEAKQLIQVGIHDQSAILRPFAMPPSTPKDIVRTMRQGFQETMKDPQFRAEMKQANLSIDPLDAAEIEKVVASMAKLDPALAAKLRDILGIKK